MHGLARPTDVGTADVMPLLAGISKERLPARAIVLRMYLSESTMQTVRELDFVLQEDAFLRGSDEAAVVWLLGWCRVIFHLDETVADGRILLRWVA